MNSTIGIISWYHTDNDEKYISALRKKAEIWMFFEPSDDIIEKDENKTQFCIEFGGISSWLYGITGSRDYVDSFCKENVELLADDGIVGLEYMIYLTKR
jgi:hypothetical protein